MKTLRLGTEQGSRRSQFRCIAKTLSTSIRLDFYFAIVHHFSFNDLNGVALMVVIELSAIPYTLLPSYLTGHYN